MPLIIPEILVETRKSYVINRDQVVDIYRKCLFELFRIEEAKKTELQIHKVKFKKELEESESTIKNIKAKLECV
jgi:hypothetical protein